MMNTCLITEVKQQWALTVILGWVTVSVHCSCLDGFAVHTSRPKHLSGLFCFNISTMKGQDFTLVKVILVQQISVTHITKAGFQATDHTGASGIIFARCNYLIFHQLPSTVKIISSVYLVLIDSFFNCSNVD